MLSPLLAASMAVAGMLSLVLGCQCRRDEKKLDLQWVARSHVSSCVLKRVLKGETGGAGLI